jgi:hypothetical protein
VLAVLALLVAWQNPGPAVTAGALVPPTISVVTFGVGQDTSGGTATTIATTTPAWNSVTGNTEICSARSSSHTFSGLVNAAGQSFTALTTFAVGGNNRQQWWYLPNITGHTSEVITATLTSTDTFRALVCFEVSGLSLTTPSDNSANVGTGNASVVSTYTSPAFSTVNGTEIVFFGACVSALGIHVTAGTIGGTGATAIVCSGTGGSCLGAANPIDAAEYLIESTIQSSITATMMVTTTAAGTWSVAGFHP